MKEALDKVKDLFAPLENMIIEAEEMVKLKCSDITGYSSRRRKRRLVLEAEAKRKKTDEEN